MKIIIPLVLTFSKQIILTEFCQKLRKINKINKSLVQVEYSSSITTPYNKQENIIGYATSQISE